MKPRRGDSSGRPEWRKPRVEPTRPWRHCRARALQSNSATSTRALTNAILPFVEEIADKGFERALVENSALRRGTYTYDGACVRRGLAEQLGVPYRDLGGGAS